MKEALFTAPAAYPVTSTEVKAHLHYDSTAEDTYLTDLISRATDKAEADTWSKFITQTWDLYLNDFDEPILLPYPPAQSITAITYVDGNGATQTLAATVYELGEQNGVGLVRLKWNQSWPTVRGQEDGVKIRWVCGYGLAASVPPAIKHAILLLIEAMFRGAEVPQAYHDLLAGRNWSAYR